MPRKLRTVRIRRQREIDETGRCCCGGVGVDERGDQHEAAVELDRHCERIDAGDLSAVTTPVVRSIRSDR
jgi:hypothetical protein